MKRLAIILSALLLSSPAWGQCVPEHEALQSWERLHNATRTGGVMMQTAECDACKCPGDSMVACYQLMAERAAERESAQRHTEALLIRASKFGICK